MCRPSASHYARAVKVAADEVSPLALPALRLAAAGTTVDGLVERFAAAGATVAPSVAAGLIDELTSLGLVRVAGGAAERRRYVATTLGQQVLDGALSAAAAGSLAALEELRTDFLSTIAHELRTPLTAIRTSAGLLRDPSAHPSAEQRDALLGTIERNAERMQRIVGDILDLARFRAGSNTLQLRRFDALELARSAVAGIAPLAQARGQALVVHPAAEHGHRVYGDHRRLEQALVNLVSNAQRFAPDGGRVTVHVAQEGPWATWSVVDDGPGIAPEDRARLFERFFVGRGDRSGPGSGVGLGLPTALAIAQAHGGTIEVESEPGHGSTFVLRVPEAGPPDADLADRA